MAADKGRASMIGRENTVGIGGHFAPPESEDEE